MSHQHYFEESYSPARSYTVDIVFVPRHWNPNAGCFIPAGFKGFVYDLDGELVCPGSYFGTTRREAIENVRREYPGAEVL